jgi:diguanylate cyclase (GGDEF)-like protein/PAS domain S-box-containing protein
MCAKDIADSGRNAATNASFYAELVMRHASDGVVICGPDRFTLWVNPAFTAQTGYVAADLLGRDPDEVLHGPDTCRDTARDIKAACIQRQPLRTEVLNYTRDGRPIWVDLTITPIFDAAGQHTHFISTMRDITARKALEQQNDEMRHAEDLRQAERQLLALTSEWLYSARAQDELLMVVKRAMHTLIPEADGAVYIYGADRKTLDLATSWGTNPSFAASLLPDQCWALRRGRAYHYGLKPIEFACDHVDRPGTPYFCLPIIAHGETIGLMHIAFDGFEDGGMMRHMREQVLRNRWDISLICAEQISLAIANVRLRQELHDRSVRDPLTGLWNRRWFNDRAPRDVLQADRDNAPLSLIMLDIDHFKGFNDTFGHDAGDQVLRVFAEILRDTLPAGLHPCRFGGEEFVILCPGLGASDAALQADTIRAAIAGRILRHGDTDLPRITVSAGVAAFPDHGGRIDDVMKAADLALYQAKDAGRDCTCVAIPGSSG